MNKPTVIVGASENEERYSYKAAVRLKQHGHSIFPIGLRPGSVAGVPIQTGLPPFENIHTVTLYVGPQNQSSELISYVIGLKPKRILFNPGTENKAFEDLAQAQGIECLEACTLVLLSLGSY